MNRAHKIFSWKYLTIWRPVLAVFPEHRAPCSCSPPWTPFRGCGRSAAAAAHNLILAEGACPGHPCFLWKEVISHSWSPFLIYSTKEWWRRTWKLSLEDLLLGQACACLKQFFWASSFHLWNGNNICQHWRCCSDKIWWRDEDTINMWHIHLFAFQSWVDLISCGIDLQQLEAGLQFWARDWGQAMIESWIPSL